MNMKPSKRPRDRAGDNQPVADDAIAQVTGTRRRPSRVLTYLIAGSLLLHIALMVVFRPFAQTTMGFDEQANSERAELVAEREQIRKETEDRLRQKTPIPEEYREALKKEAERKKEDEFRERIKRMIRDRDEAERQRDQAFEALRKRDKRAFIEEHVTAEIEKALENTREKFDQWKAAKPEDQKTAKDRRLEERADQIADELDQKLKELQDRPDESKERLGEIRVLTDDIRRIARQTRDRGGDTREPTWELANEANDIREAVTRAQEQQAEADKLHDTSEAEDVNDIPDAAKLAVGLPVEPTPRDTSGSRADPPSEHAAETGEDGKTLIAQQDPVDSADSDADPGEVSSDADAQNSDTDSDGFKPAAGMASGGPPDTADLYEAAKQLEQQTTALVNDARAAEIAQRSDTSFGTAKKRLNTFTPDRPDLTDELRNNDAATVGELNEHRQAVQEASNQVASMANRTAAMTRRLDAIQQRRASDAGRAAALAAAARADGFASVAEGEGDSNSPGQFGYGSSAGLRAGDPNAGVGMGDDADPQGRPELKLPAAMVRANTLPGRMLTDASARKGWLYLDTWYVIGPWPVQYKDKWVRIYPPELEIDFDAVYTNGKFRDQPDHPYHEMRWQFIQSDDIKLQPPQVFGGETWYAYTEVFSDQTRNMLLAVASDDFAKVWLNDRVVWEEDEESAYLMGEALRKVTFQKGYNRILVRIGNGPGPLVWSVLISPPEVLDFREQAAGQGGGRAD